MNFHPSRSSTSSSTHHPHKQHHNNQYPMDDDNDDTTGGSVPMNISISNTDIIRLILCYLSECGLYETCEILRHESGIGYGSSCIYQPNYFTHHLVNGEYHILLRTLQLFDIKKIEDYYYHTISTSVHRNNLATTRKKKMKKTKIENSIQQQQQPDMTPVTTTTTTTPMIVVVPSVSFQWLLGSLHELFILELADLGQWDLAYSTYRYVQNELHELMVDSNGLHNLYEQLFGDDNNETNKNSNHHHDNEEEEEDPNNDSNGGGTGTGIGTKRKTTTTTSTTTTTDPNLVAGITIGRLVEQKLAELANVRMKDPNCSVPNYYYYDNNNNHHSTSTTTASGTGGAGTTSGMAARQRRRKQLGHIFDKIIPKQPKNRLVTLLQQALKWQAHTGQIPQIQRIIHPNNNNNNTMDHDDDDDIDDENKNDMKELTSTTNLPIKNQSITSVVKEFDLLLGEVYVDPITVGTSFTADDYFSKTLQNQNQQQSSFYHNYTKWSMIKLGKRTIPEVALFLPDSSCSLITGTSDGYIEIWDERQQYTKLRTYDLVYQQNDHNLLGHFLPSNHNNNKDHNNKVASISVTSLAVTNDCQMLASGDSTGVIHIWKIQNGTLLRTLSTTTGSSSSSTKNTILTLSFAPDGSKILCGQQNGQCYEFGLRTSRILKVFHGHTTYITSCYYHIPMTTTNSGTSTSTSSTGNNLLSVDYERNKHTSNNDVVASKLLVITSSGDGTVRVWDGITADMLWFLRPIPPVGVGPSRSFVSGISGGNIRVRGGNSSNQDLVDHHTPPIAIVLMLHTPRDTMIIIPRGQVAYLVHYQGYVLMTYQHPTTNSKTPSTSSKNNMKHTTTKGQHEQQSPLVFVTGTVSSNNQIVHLVTEDGTCCLYRVITGEIIQTIRDFGTLTTSSSSSSSSNAATSTTPSSAATEITSVLHHPTKKIVAAFSNMKGQKKGQIVLWKS